MSVDCLVVGWGAVTRNMLRVLEERPWYTSAGIVELRPEAIEAASSTHPQTPMFDNLAQALAEVAVDAVIVNTPSHLHFDQVAQSLDAGTHVLVAKPVTNDFGQAAELVDHAARQGVTLSVGQQMRFMRHYQAVARCIASGSLGTVEAINLLNSKPRPKPGNLATMDQPALYEMACHHFDSLAGLMPDQVPQSISCDTFLPSWSAYAANSMVNAWIRYAGGLHVLYQAGFAAQGPNYELRIEGSSGALRCRGEHMSIDAMTNEIARDGADFMAVEIDADLAIVNPWDPFADEWHAYLNGGPEPSFSGRHNLRVMALLSAGIESARRGGIPVEVAGNPLYGKAFVRDAQSSSPSS